MSIQNELCSACRMMLSPEYLDFWVCGRLSDASFEEGTRKPLNRYPWYPRCVATYERIIGNSVLVQRLKDGINGNLRSILAQLTGEIASEWSYGSAYSADIGVRLNDRASPRAVVEVKSVWDGTGDKWHREPARDKRKLFGEIRQFADESTEFWQVVFVDAFPNYRYPPGLWYGQQGVGRRKRRYPSVEEQYTKIRNYLSEVSGEVQSAFEFEVPLNGLSEASHSLIAEWFANAFVPDAAHAWEWDPAHFLDGATIRCIIFKY